MVPYFTQMMAHIISILKMYFTSLERLLQFTALPQEKPHFLPTDTADWPSRSEIEFKNAALTYRPGLPPALHGLTLLIPAGTNVGVVGRTGAGKSSLLGLLFPVPPARAVHAMGKC